MIKTYIRYYYSNNTTSEHEVSSRSMPDKIPDMVYAFMFYDQQQIMAPDGEICYGEEKNPSHITFVDCVKLTRSNLIEILTGMDENCESQVVISRFGHIYSCEETDKFVVREELENLY